jgi:hypothetical protein
MRIVRQAALLRRRDHNQMRSEEITSIRITNNEKLYWLFFDVVAADVNALSATFHLPLPVGLDGLRCCPMQKTVLGRHDEPFLSESH